MIIRPEASQYRLLDQVDASELINIGGQAAKDGLPQLRHAVSFCADLDRRLRDMFSPKKSPLGDMIYKIKVMLS